METADFDSFSPLKFFSGSEFEAERNIGNRSLYLHLHSCTCKGSTVYIWISFDLAKAYSTPLGVVVGFEAEQTFCLQQNLEPCSAERSYVNLNFN